MPVVSVVLTSYNHRKFIREAIQSVLNQTFEDWELIIWDDDSVDDSWEIISAFIDPRIKRFRNPKNEGPVFGINRAISEVATGKYIAIHHSDDVWFADKLQKQVDYLDQNPDIGAVFSEAQIIDELGRPLSSLMHFNYNARMLEKHSRYEWLNYFFLHGNALWHPSVLIRKHCYDVFGLYDDYLIQVPDLDMWVRLCSAFEIHVMPGCLIKFRVLDGEKNTSGNRSDTRIRTTYEYYKVLQHFARTLSKDAFFKIFPDYAFYDRGTFTDYPFILAKICQYSQCISARQMLGVDILFDIFSQPLRRLSIEKAYGFTLKDFIQATGKTDIFSTEAEHLSQKMRSELAEMAHQLNVIRLNEVNSILSSRSWKITAPLRWLGHFFSKTNHPSKSDLLS